MTSANTSTQQELQDQFLAIVRKGQEIALDAIKSMVDTVATITPKIPTVDVPFADQLPKPQDVVASGYDFAQKLLTSQRKFADEVVKAAAPLLPGTTKQDEGGKAMASTPTQDLQNEVLNTVRKSQETVIDALKTWVETVQS